MARYVYFGFAVLINLLLTLFAVSTLLDARALIVPMLLIIAPIAIINRIENDSEKLNTKAFLWGIISSTALMLIFFCWALVSGIKC